MSLLSEQSPKSALVRKRNVLLALSQVGIHGADYKNEMYQRKVESNLKQVTEKLVKKREDSNPLHLRIDTSTCNEEAYDTAIVHLRSPMLSSDFLNSSSTNSEDSIFSFNFDKDEEVNSFQISLPRYSLKGSERKQHFYLDIVEQDDDNAPKQDTDNMHLFVIDCSEKLTRKESGETDQKTDNDAKLQVQKLSIDTSSFDVNLDAARYFKEANRFHEKLRPQPVDSGFDEWLAKEDRKCEEMFEKVMTPKRAPQGKKKDEAYPGQQQLFEEMRLMDIRRVEQEKEIQDLIMREKEYATMNMRNICNYLRRNVNLKQIAEEEAKKLRREAREKAVANLVSKKLKKKEKKKPRWLQLYEDSEKRMTRAKQRQMQSKKLSSEALGEKEPKKK